MRLPTLFIGVVAVVGVACSRIPVPVAPQVTNSPPARPSVEAPGESITVQSEAPHEEAPKPAFEPKPIRVRNIFIWSMVVFCASSRMMNESFRVRPRI